VIIATALAFIAAHGDIANACFEAWGAFSAIQNVRALRKAKKFVGVNLWSWAFFTVWGAWNIAYYPALHQWFSAIAGAMLAGANLTWTALAVYYSRRGNHGTRSGQGTAEARTQG
jgi:hypothetical protein